MFIIKMFVEYKVQYFINQENSEIEFVWQNDILYTGAIKSE